MDHIGPADDPSHGLNGHDAADGSIAVPSAGSQPYPTTPVSPMPGRPQRRPSIRLMRLPNTQRFLVQPVPPGSDPRPAAHTAESSPTGRRRSSSEPTRIPLNSLLGDPGASTWRNGPMSPLSEEPSRGMSDAEPQDQPSGPSEPAPPAQGVVLRPIENKQSTENLRRGRISRMNTGARSMLGLNRVATHNGAVEVPALPQGEYEAEVVDLLDVVGMLFTCLSECVILIQYCRSRSIYHHIPYQRSEFSLYS